MIDDQKDVIDYILDGVFDRLEPIVQKFSQSRQSQMMEFFESDHNHSYNANVVDGMYTIFEGLHAVADAIREKKSKFIVDKDPKDPMELKPRRSGNSQDPMGLKGGSKWQQ